MYVYAGKKIKKLTTKMFILNRMHKTIVWKIKSNFKKKLQKVIIPRKFHGKRVRNKTSDVNPVSYELSSFLLFIDDG